MTKTNIVRIETNKSVGSNIIDMIDIVVVDEQVQFNMKMGKVHDCSLIRNGSFIITDWDKVKKHTRQRKQTFRFGIKHNKIDNCQMIKIQSRPNNFSSSTSISETTKRGRVAIKNSNGSWDFFPTHTVPFTKKDKKIFNDIVEVAEKKFQEIKESA